MCTIIPLCIPVASRCVALRCVVLRCVALPKGRDGTGKWGGESACDASLYPLLLRNVDIDIGVIMG